MDKQPFKWKTCGENPYVSFGEVRCVSAATRRHRPLFCGKSLAMTVVLAFAASTTFSLAASADEWTEITYDDIPAEVTERSGALIPLDAVSYIQDNLILHFDGIRNAGATAAHDANATTWGNLGSLGSSCDATKETISGANSKATTGEWGDSCYRLKGAEYFAIGSAVTLGGEITVQVFADYDWSKQVVNYPGFFGSRTTGDSFAALYFDTRNANNEGKVHYKTSYSGDGSFTGWVPPYMALLFDKDNGKIGFNGGSETTWNDGGSMSDVPSYSYNIGAQGDTDSRRSGRAMVADIHAVRVYKKVLTEDELAWNKMLDEVRFRDVNTNINVIVESNVAGVNATDANGKYMVNGHHTFSAPASVTVDGCVYVPSGYSLEVWNAAANCWGEAEAHTGEMSFDYTNCLARAKVRLIWNWTLQSGVKKYDADSYVQGGLLLNYDGIRNVGLNAAHSTDTTTWANLGSLGSSRDAAKIHINRNSPGEWSQKGYDFKGADCFTAGGTADFGQRMTAQVVTDSSPTWRNTYRTRWPSPLGCTESDNTFIIYGQNYGYLTGTYYLQSAKTSGKSVSVTPWNGRFFNVVVSTNTISLSDGELSADNTVGKFTSNDDGLTMVVGSSKADDNYWGRCFAGRIYSARWYNRVLTADEIKRNNDIDWCRFFGATGRSSETDLVEVRSERPEVEFDAAGVYIVRGEGSSLSLSVPESVTAGDATYTCAGYRVETWDAASKTWGSPVETANATSAAISGTTGGANRRVTWLWTMAVQGLRAATDYDVSDYVQKGLVAHFDGIRNEGADIAHGNRPEALWRNLVTDGPDARNMTLANSVPSDATDGAWTDNGYKFNGKNYYAILDALTLGGTVTAQVFTDFNHDLSDCVSDYPGFLGSTSADKDNFFVYGYKYRPNQLYFKTTYGTGTHGHAFLNWTTPHISILFDKTGGRYGLNSGGNTDWVTATLSDIPSLSYAIGTAHSSDKKKGERMLVANIHAVRLYNRVLTDAELAQNRRVDEIRFHGIGDITVVNGAVGETGTAGESSHPDGVYNLETDSWTFTAPDMRVDDQTYKARLLVETWDGEKWVKESEGWANAYTFEKSAGQRTRLTWSWKIFRALIISVR